MGSTLLALAMGQRRCLSLVASSLGGLVLNRYTGSCWGPLATFLSGSTSDVSPASSSSSSCFCSFFISLRSFSFFSRLSDATKAARRVAGGKEERSSLVDMVEGEKRYRNPPIGRTLPSQLSSHFGYADSSSARPLCCFHHVSRCIIKYFRELKSHIRARFGL